MADAGILVARGPPVRSAISGLMRASIAVAVLLLATASTPGQTATAPAVVALDAKVAAGFAALALKCLHTEYPNHISHSMDSDADAGPPHILTPAFYGCYDWHSD